MDRPKCHEGFFSEASTQGRWEVYRSARPFNRWPVRLLCSAQSLSKFDSSGDMAANVSGRCTTPEALEPWWPFPFRSCLHTAPSCRSVPPWLPWLPVEWLDLKRSRCAHRTRGEVRSRGLMDQVTFYTRSKNIQQQRFRLSCHFSSFLERCPSRYCRGLKVLLLKWKSNPWGWQLCQFPLELQLKLLLGHPAPFAWRYEVEDVLLIFILLLCLTPVLRGAALIC